MTITYPQLNGIGRLGSPTGFVSALFDFSSTISVVIGVLTVAGGLWFMVQLFMGAFAWLTSGGDKGAVEGARKRITHALIGLILVISAFVIMGLISLIFGLNLLAPADYINRLVP